MSHTKPHKSLKCFLSSASRWTIVLLLFLPNPFWRVSAKMKCFSQFVFISPACRTLMKLISPHCPFPAAPTFLNKVPELQENPAWPLLCHYMFDMNCSVTDWRHGGFKLRPHRCLNPPNMDHTRCRIEFLLSLCLCLFVSLSFCHVQLVILFPGALWKKNKTEEKCLFCHRRVKQMKRGTWGWWWTRVVTSHTRPTTRQVEIPFVFAVFFPMLQPQISRFSCWPGDPWAGVMWLRCNM